MLEFALVVIVAKEHDGRCLAEVDEIEIDGDGVTFRGNDLDGGGIGSERVSAKIELEGRASQDARTTASAAISGAAVKIVGGEGLAAVVDLNLEVPPKVTGARHQRLRRAGAPVRRGRHEPAIRIRQLDLNKDEHEFFLTAVIVQSLLGTVVADVTVGILDKLDERRQESDRGDIRTGLGRWGVLNVFTQDRRKSSVVALAEEVGFADGLIGEGSVDGKSGQGNTKGHEEAGGKSKGVTHFEQS